MSEPKRYFINNFADGGTIPDSELQKQRTETLVSTVVENFKQNTQNADGGLYVGLAGVSYMLYHLSKIPTFQHVANQYLKNAETFLKLPLEIARRNSSSGHITDKTGFMTGNVGVFAVAAVVYKQLGKEKECEDCLVRLREAGSLMKPLNWFSKGGDEIFVGRSGFLCGVLWLKHQLGILVVPEAEVDQMLDTLVASGQQYAKAVRSPFPLMYHYYGTQYLGPAHGLAGILLIILNFPDWLERNPQHKQLVKLSVDCLLQLQTASGNFPCAMDEVDGGRHVEDELVHWCHGAPGVVYLMARAFVVFKEQKFLDAAIRCGEVTWHKGLLKKGPGICHGVAGSGYVFLVLYQLTKDPRHLVRASQFMGFLYTSDFSRARTPDSPFSLFEGLAGAACFAGDLSDPPRASFPFFPLLLE